jgi:hypothetical protein
MPITPNIKSGSESTSFKLSLFPGKAEKTNFTAAELQHNLARYVISWLGALACLILVTMTIAFYLEEKKFQIIVPGLLSAISGVIGYIAGHTSRSNK